MATIEPSGYVGMPLLQRHRDHLLRSHPFKHDDGSFSVNMSVHRGVQFIASGGNTSIEHSFQTYVDAAEAGIVLARDWLDEHLELWAADR